MSSTSLQLHWIARMKHIFALCFVMFWLGIYWVYPNPSGSVYWQSSKWRHNGCDCVSDHQPHDCLLSRLISRLIRRRSKKTSKLRVTGLYVGNSLVTGEFPAQRASNAEDISIWWRHHDSVVVWMKIVSLRKCYSQHSVVLFTLHTFLYYSVVSLKKSRCLQRYMCTYIWAEIHAYVISYFRAILVACMQYIPHHIHTIALCTLFYGFIISMLCTYIIWIYTPFTNSHANIASMGLFCAG